MPNNWLTDEAVELEIAKLQQSDQFLKNERSNQNGLEKRAFTRKNSFDSG